MKSGPYGIDFSSAGSKKLICTKGRANGIDFYITLYWQMGKSAQLIPDPHLDTKLFTAYSLARLKDGRK